MEAHVHCVMTPIFLAVLNEQDFPTDKLGSNNENMSVMNRAPVFLLVEPSAYVRAAMRAWLEDVLAHHRVLIAENANDALRFAEQEQPTHILIETYLPDGPGFETLQQIRRTLPSARIIATHWFESRSFLEKVSAAGADRFISKQRSHAELFCLLKELEAL